MDIKQSSPIVLRVKFEFAMRIICEFLTEVSRNLDWETIEVRCGYERTRGSEPVWKISAKFPILG